jgi:hypothetical protein
MESSTRNLLIQRAVLRSLLQATDITIELVQDMAPRSTAETLKLIPGMLNITPSRK